MKSYPIAAPGQEYFAFPARDVLREVLRGRDPRDLALLMLLWGVSHSGGFDGEVPRDTLRGVGVTEADVDRLVALEYVERTNGGVLLPGWTDYNLTRAEVAGKLTEQRERKAAAQRRWREKRRASQ